MAHALNIRSDDQSSIKIEQLWQECSALEEQPSMRNLGYRPHITFAIYDNLDPELLQDAFESVFKTVRKLAIVFDALKVFESTESLVLWANPVLPIEIKVIHQRIHKLIDVTSCREHYQPTNWVPHCSIATAVPLNKKKEVVHLIHRKIEPFEVIFDVADLVSFLPVQIKREITLLEAD